MRIIYVIISWTMVIWGGNLLYFPAFGDLQPYETWKFRICSESVSRVFPDFFRISLRKCLTVLGAPPKFDVGWGGEFLRGVFVFRARKRHININFLVRLGLGRPWICHWDKRRFSPYFTQWTPSLSQGQTQLVPGTNW